MKTAQIIAEKAEQKSDKSPKPAKRKMNPKSLANLVAPWTAETRPDVQSPGRPKDAARRISQKAFENNEEEIYKAVAAKLIAGDAYAFSVHSDRAYGKLKQGVVHMGDEEGGPIQASIAVRFVEATPDGD